MTNIDELPAGREMDALIARKVMRLDVEPSSNYDGWYGDLIPIGNREFIDPQGWVYNKGKAAVPNYSTDIAAAYTMEDEIARAGLAEDYAYELKLLVSGMCKSDFMIRDGRGWYDAMEFKFIHATPEQRCRAALGVAERQ